jgi:mercuric ion transport protein
MSDSTRPETSPSTTARDTGTMVLAVGGLAAAFGAASCCALPVLLGTIGVGSVWLGSLALLAGPYQSLLLAAAVICLFAGSVLLWRRQAMACAPGSTCERPLVSAFTKFTLSLGALLVVLGFTFA